MAVSCAWNEVILPSRGGHQTLSVTWLGAGWRVWTVFWQHSVDSHGQAKPNPSHTDTGLIIQTIVSECPPCGPGHMTSVQTIGKISLTCPKKDFLCSLNILYPEPWFLHKILLHVTQIYPVNHLTIPRSFLEIFSPKWLPPLGFPLVWLDPVDIFPIYSFGPDR